MIISEYSAFYPISFSDLHPEIQNFKKRGENQAGPWMNTLVNGENDMYMYECCKLDRCVFTSLFLNDRISGCRYANEMG